MVTAGSWTNIGPSNIGGRTRALLVQPGGGTVDTRTLFAGGAAGGIWKSTNSGASWTPLSDFIANLAVSTLAADPTDAGRIYAGTGEGFFNSLGIRGAGIFVTTDGGTNWSQLSATATSDFHRVNRVAVSPTNPQRLYAATSTGVWRSTDQGASWTQRLAGDVLDLVVRNNGGTDHVFVFNSGAGANISLSLDDGDTFVPPTSGGPVGQARGSFAVVSSTLAYCVVATTDSAIEQLYRSTDNGATWTTRLDLSATPQGRLNGLLFTNLLFGADLDADATQDCSGAAPSVFSQGGYDQAIAADPVDPTRVWVGGVDLFRSDDSGQNFGIASYWWFIPPGNPVNDPNYVHADIHTLVFDPGFNGTSNQIMYVGCDGGIFRTATARGAVATVAANPNGLCGTGTLPTVLWTNRNSGYGVTQFLHGAVAPTGSLFVGGTIDNGTLRFDSATPSTWNPVLSGDGGYCAIDPTNTSLVYGEFTNLDFQKSTDGGATFSPAISGITESSDNFRFTAPFAMDPSNPQRLWIGGRQAFRTVNSASSWAAASPANLTNQSISAWAIAPSGGGQIVYLATEFGGEVFRSGDALAIGPTWTRIDSGLPANASISSVAVHPTNPNQVLVAYSSFGVPGGQLWSTRDASQGATTAWSPLTGTGPNRIPDIPVHVVAISPADPGLVFVGTDLGVLGTDDAGLTWNNVNGTTLANTAVYQLVFQGAGQLFAFTHGRGVSRVALNSLLLTVATPGTNQRVAPGTASTINWTVDPSSPQSSRINSFDVAVSTDGGSTFSDLVTGLGSGARSTTWNVPASLRTTRARTRVVARSTSAVLGTFTSTQDVVVNASPAAAAGDDSTAAAGATVTLSGTGSDADGDAVSYLWTQVGGTPVTFTSNLPNPTFKAPSPSAAETLRFDLAVSDGTESVTDQLEVQVQAAATPGSTPAAAPASGGGSGGCAARHGTEVETFPEGDGPFWVLALIALAARLLACRFHAR